MNNKILMILILALVLFPLASALEQTIVTTQVRVTYTPPPLNGTGHGTLVISGENLLKSYNLSSTFDDTLENNVYRDYGTQADLTRLFDKLENCSKFYDCQMDKGNLSWYIDTILQPKVNSCANQTDYKSSFDLCNQDKASLSTQLNDKQTALTSAQNDLKSSDSSKWMYLLGGFALGFVFINYILPSIKGRNMQASGSMPNSMGSY